MSAPDLAYLSTSAAIIEQGMAGVAMILAEGSRCVLRGSRRGAQRDAYRQAILARDRLAMLIEELGEPE